MLTSLALPGDAGLESVGLLSLGSSSFPGIGPLPWAAVALSPPFCAGASKTVFVEGFLLTAFGLVDGRLANDRARWGALTTGFVMARALGGGPGSFIMSISCCLQSDSVAGYQQEGMLPTS